MVRMCLVAVLLAFVVSNASAVDYSKLFPTKEAEVRAASAGLKARLRAETEAELTKLRAKLARLLVAVDLAMAEKIGELRKARQKKRRPTKPKGKRTKRKKKRKKRPERGNVKIRRRGKTK